MKIIKYSLICFALVTAVSSCDKEDYDPQLLDIRPAIPVTLSNSTELRPGFTVRASRVGDDFKFDLEIPASSGRTIKEITKIITSTGPAGLLSATAANYAPGVITGNGSNKISFSTSLTEWNIKNPPTPPALTRIPANNPPINAVELPNQFFFQITLDDNSQLITEPIRVLVVP